jgi:hypothetical protein
MSPVTISEEEICAMETQSFHRWLAFEDRRNGICVVRIGNNYRAFGLREGDLIVWFWIGTHGKYNHFSFKIFSFIWSRGAGSRYEVGVSWSAGLCPSCFRVVAGDDKALTKKQKLGEEAQFAAIPLDHHSGDSLGELTGSAGSRETHCSRQCSIP